MSQQVDRVRNKLVSIYVDTGKVVEYKDDVIRIYCKIWFFLPLILLLLFGNRVLAEQACQSIPISVSNINNCKNGLCSMDAVVAGSLDLINGAKQCLNMVAGDGAKIATLNITFINSYAKQGVESCYYTDDVLYDTKAMAGCFGGASGDAFCTTGNLCAAAKPQFKDNIVCKSWTVFDSVCVAYPDRASFCTKTGFSGMRRFKVCTLKPKEPVEGTIRIESEQFTQTFKWDTRSKVFIDPLNTVNFTAFGTKFDVRDDVKYLVTDLYFPGNHFMGDDSNTNAYNTYDYRKTGWYKIGVKPEVDLGQLTDAIIVQKGDFSTSPTDVKFNVQYNFIMPSALMVSQPSRWTGATEGLAWFDDYEVIQARKYRLPDWSSIGWGFQVLKDGVFSYEHLNTARIAMVGQGFYDNYIPAQYTTDNTTFKVYTNKKREVVGRWKMHCSPIWMRNGCGTVCVAESATDSSEYGFCYKTDCAVGGGLGMQCIVFDIEALNWPSTQMVRYTFRDDHIITNWFPSEDSKSIFYYPVKTASTEYTLTMRNMTVQFLSQDVRPKVIRCYPGEKNDTSIKVEIYSDGADGNVLATMTPGLYPTVTWYIKSDKKVFSMPVSTNATGEFTIMIRNADFSDSCTVKVNYTFSYQLPINWQNVTDIKNNAGNILADLLGIKITNPIDVGIQNLIFYFAIAAVVIVIIVILVLVGVGLFFIMPYIMPYLDCLRRNGKVWSSMVKVPKETVVENVVSDKDLALQIEKAREELELLKKQK